MKISILCPSRGRPTRFLEMADSALMTAADHDAVDVRLAVDADDPTREQYPAPHHVNHGRRAVSHIFNVLAAGADGDILMAAADDVLFRTPGWDQKVREVAARFPDGLFIASPVNGAGQRRVNHWFTGRQWLGVFGWFMPAHFEHFCDDEWVQEVAGPCGRLVYMDDVLIEHMHKKYGKSPNDETYDMKRQKAADGSSMSERDIATFNRLTPQRIADTDKLRSAIGW